MLTQSIKFFAANDNNTINPPTSEWVVDRNEGGLENGSRHLPSGKFEHRACHSYGINSESKEN